MNTRDEITDAQAEALEERLTDAVERTLDAHDMLDDGQACSCGARNNMDGDVLHGHRISAISDAIEAVIRGFFTAR